MAKPKKRRPKTVRPTIPGIPVFKALNRPVQQQEDRLARVVADGVHRPLSEAGFGTGAGEWGFHVANRHRPKPIRHLVDHEDAMRASQLMLEVEGWIRTCAESVIDRRGPTPPRVLKRHEYVLGGVTIVYEAWA